MAMVPQVNKDGLSVAAGAEFSIFGYDMIAMVEASPSSDGTVIKALVMPDMDMPAQEQAIGKLLERVGETVGKTIDKTSVNNVLKYVDMDVDETMVRLNQAFVLYDGTQPKDSPRTEYAFSVSIKNNKPKDGGIFTIKSISFALWNTTRPVVLESMNLSSIEGMLGKLEARRDQIAAKTAKALEAPKETEPAAPPDEPATPDEPDAQGE